MTEAAQERLLNKLTEHLERQGFKSPDTDWLLSELEMAEAELLLYLNRESLPELMESHLLRLAALSCQMQLGEQAAGLKSASYSEGEQSQSVTFLTAEEQEAGREKILRSLARYRKVALKRREQNDPQP